MSSDHEQANPTHTPVNNASENFNEAFLRFLHRQNLNENLRRFLHRQNLDENLRSLDQGDNYEESVENPVAEPGLDLAQTLRPIIELTIDYQTLILVLTDDNPLETGYDFLEHEEFLRSLDSEKVDSLLSGLPAVETATLPEDDQSCPVCREKYETPSAAATTSEEAPETEPAIQLRCNHVFGKSCLKRWLESGNTTCPLCRANVYTQ